jgi:V-type H+-transporting ATPase subunit a
MILSEIIFTQESMWETMNHLAHKEKVMFTHKAKAANPGVENSLQKYANNMVKRCEELLGSVKIMSETMSKFDFETHELSKNPKSYITLIDNYREIQGLEGQQLFEMVEEDIGKKFETLNQHLEHRKRLLEKTISDFEKMQAIQLCEEMIPMDFANRDSSFDEHDDKKLQAFYGLLPTENLQFFQRILFRMTRGNIFFKSKNLNHGKDLDESDIKDCDVKPKSLIFILTPSGDENILHNKIKRLLLTNNFESLDIPYVNRRNEMRLGFEQEINDNQQILRKTNMEIEEILTTLDSDDKVPGLGFISLCRLVITRELNFARKLIFIEKRENLYSLMVWVPKKYFSYMKTEMEQMGENEDSFTPPKLIEHHLKEVSRLREKKIPTYFDTDVLKSPFQQIVDTYGVPRYQEANPALFTIISFPFFFGLMYGDIGHGSLMFVVGILMVTLIKDPNSPLYQAKWLIFLMGFFAVYCGFVYSEFFATPFPLFKSCYDIESPTYQKISPDCVYPFGFDYIWYLSDNETSYLNSFKMKFSIIIGVIQMLFGTFLKSTNAIYFGKWEDLIFEAIPQFLFMFVTFGYMSFCIIYKWLINWDGKEPPSIIQLFINFTNVEAPLYGPDGLQQTLQTIFLITCVVCFFLMILPKPIVLYMRQKNEHQKGKRLDTTDDELESKNALFSRAYFFHLID